MVSNITKVNGANAVALDSSTFTKQTWKESGIPSANTFIVEPTTSSTSLSLTGISGDIVVIKGYSGDYTAKLSGKLLTLQSDTQVINVTLASLSSITLTFLDGSKTVDTNAKTLDKQLVTKVALHIDGPTAHEIASLKDAAQKATTALTTAAAAALAHENAALATSATNAAAHESAALATAAANASSSSNTITTLLNANTQTINSALDILLPSYHYQSDFNGTSMSFSTTNSDKSITEFYSYNSNDGHQNSTISQYDSASNLVSRKDTNTIQWQDDAATSHTREDIHTLTNSTNGNQVETLVVKDDDQVTSSNSTEYDVTGNITRSTETQRVLNENGNQTTSSTSLFDEKGSSTNTVAIQADNSQTETYTADDNIHSIKTSYDYDTKGNRISSSDDESVTWQDDAGISHTQQTLHTQKTNADGTQSESFTSIDDGQKTTFTLEEITSTKINTSPFNAASSNVSFIIAEGNYPFNIANFDIGDSLIFSNTKSIPVISNSNASDGILDVIYSSNNATTTIHLTGITPAQDASIGTSYDDFLNTFATTV